MCFISSSCLFCYECALCCLASASTSVSLGIIAFSGVCVHGGANKVFDPVADVHANRRPQGNGNVKRWSSLSAYFLSKLTGTQQPMTFSEASCTGLMDREEMQWHQGLLNLLGIHLMTLPSLCDADELYMGGISADLRKRWPELTKTPWARGISEAAAFHIGTGCDVGSRRRVCVHMGTSAAIRLCVPCKDRRYRGGKTSGSGHKGSAHSSESSRKSAAKMGGEIGIQVPSGLFQYSIKRDLMLVGGTLADGGSIYAWGTEQLAGGSATCLFLVWLVRVHEAPLTLSLPLGLAIAPGPSTLLTTMLGAGRGFRGNGTATGRGVFHGS